MHATFYLEYCITIRAVHTRTREIVSGLKESLRVFFLHAASIHAKCHEMLPSVSATCHFNVHIFFSHPVFVHFNERKTATTKQKKTKTI